MNKKYFALLIVWLLCAIVLTGMLVHTTVERHRITILADKAIKVERLLRADLQEIHDLSIEFNINPLIVEIVRDVARTTIASTDQSQWRLIKTPEFATYLMLSLIYAESNGRATAIGDMGKARGLTQIWTSTAAMYSKEKDLAKKLLDPQFNIEISFKHFAALLKKYRGNVALVLYAWNRGPGKVDKLIAYGQSPANGYGRRVYRAAEDANRGRLM